MDVLVAESEPGDADDLIAARAGDPAPQLPGKWAEAVTPARPVDVVVAAVEEVGRCPTRPAWRP